MAESLSVTGTTRAEKYESLLPQLDALVTGEPDLIANLANIAAALKESFSFFWVGFYLVKETQLVLGPFQGPVACTRISFDKGVCGACYTRREIMLVPDVDAFPGHIACSGASRSEIVLPAFRGEDVFLVLDIDSDQLNDFDETDAHYLAKVMRLIEGLIG
ncbi:GAF domain-containing protein [Catalinimonas alkaloidigena]|uniref:GAF domain-containing protein n=1 Tax=Catalinimonas alkaloidigena TaxID=1075417 RepID=A0A1G9Q4E9_9BACT|nr:GAF domain-containing protein [Catalinimonas alkaloidigena]SDM05225.1 GAF domain-containing protein [Catalinimonas alkaloidigena]